MSQTTAMCGSRRFCQRGSNFDVFIVFVFLMRGGRIQIPLKAGHCWPGAEMPLKWHSEGEQMMAQL